MNSFLQNDTDAEMDRYQEANEFAAAAFDPMAEKVQKLRYNSTTRKNDIVLPMQAGGFFKIGEADLPQPDVMDAAPEKPLDMRVQDVKDYNTQFNNKLSYADIEAAGMDREAIMAAGILPPEQGPMQAEGTVQPTRPDLSENEITEILANGGGLLGRELDPSLREEGFIQLTEFLLQNAVEGRRQELVEQAAEAFKQSDDTPRSIPQGNRQTNDQQIEMQLQSEMRELRTIAETLADGVFGYRNIGGIGVGDFMTAGVMDIQEGYRMYMGSINDDGSSNSNTERVLGLVVMAAGVAEATGVGYGIGKLIKASVPKLRAGLTAVGNRLNQPGEMPTTSSFGVGEFAPGQSPQKLETPDINTQVDAARIAYESNPNDSSLKKQYLTLRRERDADPVAQIEAPTETKPGIIAFHGSGLNFNKFKLEKIGTGEGNQAFGYGLYFTDSKDIAKFYRDSVGMGNKVKYKGKTVQDLDNDFASKEENIAHMVGQQNNKKDRVRVIENEIAMTQRNLSGIQQSIKDNKSNPKVYPLKFHGMELELEKAVEIEADFQDRLNAAVEVQKNISSIETQPSGKLYKVGIEPTENELLNYDVGFQDQTPFIQTAIEKVLDQINVDDAINLGIDVFSPPYNGNEQAALQAAKDQMLRDFSVVRFLNDWSVLRGAENSGEQLLEGAGVKGITYKANQGVGARNAPETGTRNYVIFDDKMIKILEKYGIVGPVAIGAMAATPKEQQDET